MGSFSYSYITETQENGPAYCSQEQVAALQAAKILNDKCVVSVAD